MKQCENTLSLATARTGAWKRQDLRRTGATMMQTLGFPLETFDRCQNHVLKGSKARRHCLHRDYDEEKPLRLGYTRVEDL